MKNIKCLITIYVHTTIYNEIVETDGNKYYYMLLQCKLMSQYYIGISLIARLI